MKAATFIILLAFVAVAGVSVETMQFRIVGLDGGEPPDLVDRAASYLGLPETKRSTREQLQKMLPTVFPVGMKRSEVYAKMRAVRRAHLWDTALSSIEYGELLQNGSPLPGEIELRVFTYTRIIKIEGDKEVEDVDGVSCRYVSISFIFDQSDTLYDHAVTAGILPL